MASTYLSLHYHIVSGTKNREPWIADSWIGELHNYMGGTINGLGGYSQGVGGIHDHVHLLVGLKSTHCLADVVRELKKSSNEWVREKQRFSAFRWQEGYAAFTVSPTARDPIRDYIANQKEHHAKRVYREELIQMLQQAGIDYDEKYLD